MEFSATLDYTMTTFLDGDINSINSIHGDINSINNLY